MAIATCLCLGAVEDLQLLLDISRRGGHSDAALAAAVTPLSSWMWAAIWMLLGVAACVLATWSAAGREPPETGAAPTVAKRPSAVVGLHPEELGEAGEGRRVRRS